MHIHKKSLNLKASVRLVFQTICEQQKWMAFKQETMCLVSAAELANSMLDLCFAIL